MMFGNRTHTVVVVHLILVAYSNTLTLTLSHDGRGDTHLSIRLS